MYFTVKIALRTLLLPPASPLILIFIGWVLLQRYRRVGGGAIAVGCLTLWLLSTPVIANRLYRATEAYGAFDTSQPTNAQAIVIIGGGGVRPLAPEYQGPAPDSLLLDRLGYGSFLSRTTGLPILISGTPEEVIVMQAALQRNFGLQPTWVEGDSRDTYQNARFSRNILKEVGVSRVLLVTMSTHMGRATAEFRDAGFTVTPAPSGLLNPGRLTLMSFIPTSNALDHSSNAVYELLGEPARRIQAALGVREIFESKAAPR